MYKIIPHTADLKIWAQADSKQELFKEIARAMFSWAGYEEEKKAPIIEEEIEISSLDIESLLIDFLNELLFLAEAKRLKPIKINFPFFKKTSLKAKIIAKRLKRIGIQIKAATFHDLKIENKNGLWQAIVLFDI